MVEGFIGSTLEGETTTLGRGGSDYTATTIAALLKASNVHIITDVPGIMTADPKYVKNARIIPKMNYREALEASIYGCRNMHPRTFHPLAEAQKMQRPHRNVGNWNHNIPRRLRELQKTRTQASHLQTKIKPYTSSINRRRSGKS